MFLKCMAKTVLDFISFDQNGPQFKFCIDCHCVVYNMHSCIWYKINGQWMLSGSEGSRH